MAKKARSTNPQKGRRGASPRKRGLAALKARRFRIAPDFDELCLRTPHTHYVTGTTASGEQAILLPDGPMMHAFWFNAKGKYLRTESREMSGWSMDKPHPERLRDKVANLQAWVKELELTPGIIEVNYSNISGPPRLSIHDYPMSWDGAEWGEGETLEGMLEWWDSLGAFVLMGNGFEHNIDRNGHRFQ
jgi:hypothetical protein